MTPTLSIIIPSYNSEKYITLALDSIYNQSLDKIEVICIDDGSTDNTANIIKAYPKPIKYVYQENQGAPAARNLGISLATASVVGLLDSDDIYAPGSLSTRLNYLLDDDKALAVIGKTKFLFTDGHNRHKWNLSEDSPPVYNTLYGSGLYKKTLFEAIGSFNENFKLSDDFDWFTRLRESGLPITYIEDITLYYRQHNSNMTGNADLVKHDLLSLLRNSLIRRRSTNSGEAAEELLPFGNS